MEYGATQSRPAAASDADQVTDELSEREAGVAHEVIGEYVGVDASSLDGFYRIAEQKLTALQQQREVTEGIRNAGIG